MCLTFNFNANLSFLNVCIKRQYLTLKREGVLALKPRLALNSTHSCLCSWVSGVVCAHATIFYLFSTCLLPPLFFYLFRALRQGLTTKVRLQEYCQVSLRNKTKQNKSKLVISSQNFPGLCPLHSLLWFHYLVKPFGHWLVVWLEAVVGGNCHTDSIGVGVAMNHRGDTK